MGSKMRTVGLNIKLYLSLYLLFGALPSNILCHRCYVCGPSNLGFKQACDHIHINPEQFEHECDSTAQSCSTQHFGDIVTRQCEEDKFKDCKIANNVKYCYCLSDLCNGDKPGTMPNDDEDLTEGSGSHEEPELSNFVPTIETSKANKMCGTIALIISTIVFH